MTEHERFVAYPPIERHGVIGDRRTAALVAADGTLDWLCMADYDGAALFGALLDETRGGFWRAGPVAATLGRQRYLDDSATLVTHWADDKGELELTDAMAWPGGERGPGREDQRVVLRRVRCTRGGVRCAIVVRPRDDFGAPGPLTPTRDGFRVAVGRQLVEIWSDRAGTLDEDGFRSTFRLGEGEAAWVVLTLGEAPARWTPARAERVLAESTRYWHDWVGNLAYTGPRRDRVRRSALAVHLLSHAPTGSLVAAPTTSLPERIGGDRNYDYRFAWIRDASLSLASLSLVGDTEAARAYMDWLVGLGSATEAPLQVVYRIDGGTDLAQHERTDLSGYRGSLPVRSGNHAYTQRQLDAFGYLADCAYIYHRQGGRWRPEYWELVRRIADYAAAHWREPDSGIWELGTEQHYVSSKVMSWVTLERATKLAESLGHTEDTDRWQSTVAAIHAEVMDRGWSERLGAFRQRYEADSLDASALLIPVMGFLPADHPRVTATVARIVDELTINGFVHRFDPRHTPGGQDLPLAEFEGAFLPCTFWLATAHAKAGRPDLAEEILGRAEAIAGELGLFAEEVDPRTRTFLGNMPLLFSQVEYVRAVLETAKAKPLDKARLMVGQVEQRLGKLLSSDRSSEP
ncbi:MAG: glycoside hydrolase family 15 protein [Chloroflexota bacterium]|nr:glycoside hydrolase family 15 protein [Chloroflexota bacterium]